MTALELARWHAVPTEAVRLAGLAAPTYEKVAAALGEDPSWVYLNPDTGRLVTKSVGAATKLAAAGIDCVTQARPLPADEPWVPIKSAAWSTKAIFKPVLQAANLAPSKLNAPFGGPTPLAGALSGGLLGAGVGYLGGRIAENLLPESVIQRGRLRKVTALLGGAMGTVPGIWLGTEGMRNFDEPGKSKWNAWVRPNNLFGGQPEQPPAGMAAELDPGNMKQGEFLRAAAHGLAEAAPDAEPEPDFVKAAIGEGGGLFMPSIPVDLFNRAVLVDPFATPQLQAATIGMTEAANQSRGGMGIISPYDLARIGVGMGAGLAQAYLGGKVLGALAGLTPQAQKRLQQTGAFAGALKAVVPGLFGG
jgi:hypothetical protein